MTQRTSLLEINLPVSLHKILPGIIALIAAIMFPHSALAQGEPQLTQYWAMPTLYNPAASGDTDFVRIRGGAKLQWLGITNAPKSFLGTSDSPFRLMGQKFGAGVTVNQESLGLFSNLLISAQLSFRFKLLKGELAIGIQPGYYSSKFKGSEVYIPDNDDYHNSNDPSIPTQDMTGSAFDLSAGIRYTHKYFSFGVGGMHIMSPSVNLQTQGSQSSETTEYETELPRMVYFIGDSNIPLRNTLFELQPSFLVKTDFSMFAAEVTLRATYNKFLTFGASYRWKDAVSVMAGVTFKNFFLGYAYDYPLSAIAKASSGSHELLAGYQLKLDFSGKNKNKHRSIRLM